MPTPNRIIGFTLIEILVVMLIISIMSGIAVAKLPSFVRSSDFDLEAKRLFTLLTMSRDEAISQAYEFGFKPTDNGYEFYNFNEQSKQWQTFEVQPFQARTLPDDIKIDLQVEGKKLELSDDEKTPPILILSSGEMTPFKLTISQIDREARTMESDGYGDIIWREQ